MIMAYQLLLDNSIFISREDGGCLHLPPQNNGTPEWREYQAWLDAGNTPEPAPPLEPAPILTTEQKLNAAGLTVAELKELFGLT
jgi:hypothetical protein